MKQILKSNKKKPMKKEDSKSAEKPIVEQKNIVPPVQDKSDIKPTKDSKEPEAVAEPWKGTDIGIGGTVATGDNATTNVNALANVSYQPREEWKNKLFFNYVYSRDDRSTTPEAKQVK